MRSPLRAALPIAVALAAAAPAAASEAAPPRTHASGGDKLRSGFRVPTLQHDVVADVIELIDGVPRAAFAALGTTLQYALDAGDAALRDILSFAQPSPSDEDDDPDAGAQVLATRTVVDQHWPPIPAED